jgi:hypothetical protein
MAQGLLSKPYVVNPYSKNMEEAVRFIECTAELECDPYLYYAIHPDLNTPYEWPNFQEQIQSAVEEKAYYEDVMNQLDGAYVSGSADIQAMIDYYDLFLKDQEEERWEISADTISTQRKLLETLDLHTDSIYLGASGSTADQMISELCDRYVNGNLTMDAMLDELGNKMRMMQMEEQ